MTNLPTAVRDLVLRKVVATAVGCDVDSSSSATPAPPQGSSPAKPPGCDGFRRPTAVCRARGCSAHDDDQPDAGPARRRAPDAPARTSSASGWPHTRRGRRRHSAHRPTAGQGPGFFGPLHHPLPMSLTAHARLGHVLRRRAAGADGGLARAAARHGDARAASHAVMERCDAGDFDDGDRAGPAARRPVERQRDVDARGRGADRPGGARRTPGDRPRDAGAVRLPAPRRRDRRLPERSGGCATGGGMRVGLHQLYPLLAHVVLFGGGLRRFSAHHGRAATSALAPP